MRISDWSSDVCSSDLVPRPREQHEHRARQAELEHDAEHDPHPGAEADLRRLSDARAVDAAPVPEFAEQRTDEGPGEQSDRAEEQPDHGAGHRADPGPAACAHPFPTGGGGPAIDPPQTARTSRREKVGTTQEN